MEPLPDLPELMHQVLRAIGYYLAVLLLARVAGKRLAGQMTTFDLIVLIALATATQRIAVADGTHGAIVFVIVVLLTHRGVALLGARFPALRRLLRGKPTALVVDGVAIPSALRDEAVSEDELLAGLRKLGFERIDEVKLAVLEETGHISAVGM